MSGRAQNPYGTLLRVDAARATARLSLDVEVGGARYVVLVGELRRVLIASTALPLRWDSGTWDSGRLRGLHYGEQFEAEVYEAVERALRARPVAPELRRAREHLARALARCAAAGGRR